MQQNIKKAAIKLNEISSHDRKWILAQLEEPERNQLEKALGELALINGDHQLSFESILAMEEASSPEAEAKRSKKLNGKTREKTEIVNSLSLEAITAALNKLPLSVGFYFLDSGVWNQAEMYKEAFSKGQKSSYQSHLSRQKAELKPAVQCALVDLVIEKAKSVQ